LCVIMKPRKRGG